MVDGGGVGLVLCGDGCVVVWWCGSGLALCGVGLVLCSICGDGGIVW